MIFDSLSLAEKYFNISPLFPAAFTLAKKLADENAPDGKYFAENGVYASVSSYDTKDKSLAKYENHRSYIDIQLLISGSECLICGDTDDTYVTEKYIEGKDIEFYARPEKAPVQALSLTKGKFALLFPGDLHAPGLTLGENAESVRKIVVKIPV